jgi:UPF0755 protein
VDFEVSPGVGSARVARELFEQKLLRDPTYFKWFLRITGKASALKTGLYQLNNGMTAEQMALVLTEGKVKTISLTIPEGWTNRQIGDYLASKGVVKDREAFLRLTKDPAILAEFKIPADTTEGYLFPDTYSVPVGFPADKLHRMMLKHTFLVIQNSAPAGEDAMERHRRIILASIIEREAAHPEELPMMSQVFLNRIEKRMKFESCATVQYLFDTPKARLLEKDLLIPSPYNTYLHKGFPPGPISNPGEKAIHAAYHPEPGPYLFFVLKPDGHHHFSETFAEHSDAKKRYIGP